MARAVLGGTGRDRRRRPVDLVGGPARIDQRDEAFEQRDLRTVRGRRRAVDHGREADADREVAYGVVLDDRELDADIEAEQRADRRPLRLVRRPLCSGDELPKVGGNTVIEVELFELDLEGDFVVE